MKHFVVFFLIFSVACAAKTSVPERSIDQAPSEKVTREAAPPLEFWIVAEAGNGVEILILNSISDCLREGVAPEDLGFKVQLKGRLNAKGRVVSPIFNGGNPTTVACFKGIFKDLTLPGQPAGPFAFTLSRGPEAPPGAKPFAVFARGPKKFE